MPVCPQCHTDNYIGTRYCVLCATPLDYFVNTPKPKESLMATSQLKVCPGCAGINEPNWSFCLQCGTPIVNEPIRDLAQVDIEMVADSVANGAKLDNITYDRTNSGLLQRTQDATLDIDESKVDFQLPIKNTAEKYVEKNSSKRVYDTTMCPACGGENFVDASICQYCQSPIRQTLRMGSELSQPRLILIQDGIETETYDITDADFTIGRTKGTLSFPQDNFMSSEHARIVHRGGRYVLIDEQSRNGTYKRINSELELVNGDIVMVGRQVFSFEQ